MDVARILFATDFSRDAALALEMTKETARRFGAEVIVLHVDDGAEFAPLSLDAAARREDARLGLERIREDLARELIPVCTLLRPGDPAREIVQVAAARAAGMIVLGTHGWTRSGSLLLGSVVDRVLRHATLPVLTVRHPERSVPRFSGPVS
jgi:nucleotide-binding universal stress UspA family protein